MKIFSKDSEGKLKKSKPARNNEVDTASYKNAFNRRRQPRLDREQHRQRLERFLETSSTETSQSEDSLVEPEQNRDNTNQWTKRLSRAAQVAFWPISMPVKGILYAQRHWEAFMWDGIEAAVRKRQAAKSAKVTNGLMKASVPAFIPASRYIPSLPSRLSSQACSETSTTSFSHERITRLTASEEDRLRRLDLHVPGPRSIQQVGRNGERSSYLQRSDDTIPRLVHGRFDFERSSASDPLDEFHQDLIPLSDDRIQTPNAQQ